MCCFAFGVLDSCSPLVCPALRASLVHFALDRRSTSTSCRVSLSRHPWRYAGLVCSFSRRTQSRLTRSSTPRLCSFFSTSARRTQSQLTRWSTPQRFSVHFSAAVQRAEDCCYPPPAPSFEGWFRLWTMSLRSFGSWSVVTIGASLEISVMSNEYCEIRP